MDKLTKNRTCSVCGKEIKCDCYFYDYGIVKLDNSGETYLEFDACPVCRNQIVRSVKALLKD